MLILCVPYTHTLSHLSRPLVVAQELKKRGHEVIFAGESPKISFLEKAGFTVLALHEPDPDELFGNIRGGNLKFVSDSELASMIKSDVGLFSKVKPDLVLTDGRFSAPLSSHLAGVRHAAIVNVSSTEYRAFPYIPFFDWIPTSLFGRDGTVRTILDGLNLKMEMFVFDNAVGVFKQLSRKYSVEKKVTATNCLCGKDLTLMADIPEYFPTRKLPEGYHYTGPLTWRSSLPPPSWWPPRTGAKPLIYITMGTTGISDFFQIVSEIISRSSLSAIITTGGHAAGIRSVAGKIYVEDYLDGDLVMEACDLVICHGGNGTIYQALQHGKPVLGIPTIPDQKFNMRRVETLGVGKALAWKEFSGNPDRLVELARSILDEPAFAERAASLKTILNGHDAPRTASDLIERAFS